MKNTKIAQLKIDAANAGWAVSETSYGTRITQEKVVNQYKTKVVGLFIDDCGWAWDLAIDASCIKGVRSVKVMREVLGL